MRSARTHACRVETRLDTLLRAGHRSRYLAPARAASLKRHHRNYHPRIAPASAGVLTRFNQIHIGTMMKL